VASIVKRFKACDGAIKLFVFVGQPALELLASNPLAGFCLALNEYFHRPIMYYPLTAARAQMQKNQREILGWLGFRPATESMAKIGRKCVPEALNLERCLQLRRTLGAPETRERLAHLRRIHAGVIGLIASRELRTMVTPQLLHVVAENDDEITTPVTAGLLTDIIKMRATLRHNDQLRPFYSFQRIVEEHDALVFELNNSEISQLAEEIFPLPPIPGYSKPDEEILPIRTPGALKALGREQHNCVASYHKQILNHAGYIYRVKVGAEVSTLSLIKGHTGWCTIDQLKTSCNRLVSPSTKLVVKRWFGNGSPWPLHPSELGKLPATVPL